MKWQVKVHGPAEDLRSLAESLTEESLRLFDCNGAYHFESLELDQLNSPDDVKIAAEELLQILTGAARMALGMRGPLKVVSVTRIDTDGRRHTFAYLSDTAHIRASAYGTIRTDGRDLVVVRPSDPVPRWVQLAKDDSAVSKAMRLVGAGLDGWVELYRLFEVIESDCGGVDAIATLGWAQKGKLREFKHTANSPSAAGDLARHGSESTQPPKNPMGLADAKSLVMSLLHDWIRAK